MTRLLRLYPRRWRARYGEEFSALLEEYHLSFRDTVDVVLGAIDAWRHPIVLEGNRAGRTPMGRRLMIQGAGLALILASFVLVVGSTLSGQGPDEELPFRIYKFLTYMTVPTLVLLGFVGLGLHARRLDGFRTLGKSALNALVRQHRFVPPCGISSAAFWQPAGWSCAMDGSTGRGRTMSRRPHEYTSMPLPHTVAALNERSRIVTITDDDND